MPPDTIPPAARLHRGAFWRIAWTVVTILAVEFMVCTLAVLPVAFAWRHLIRLTGWSLVARLIAFSAAAVPSYTLFALALMLLTAVATRLLGWRTPPDAEMRIADADWPVLRWARSMVALHIVRVFAGPLFRGSPIWTAYLRLSGARLGRRVYINTLSVSDYNLLEFGDDVVIGADVHLSGHTVERGLVRTAPVRLARNVTIGLGSVIDIGVEAGAGCQVGALSLVPKFSRLESGATYVGVPVERLD